MKTITTKQYFSDDGKEFASHDECWEYEFKQKLEKAGLTNFTREELTIAHGLTTVDSLPFEAPWLGPFGSSLVKVYEVKREDGKVKFGIGNEQPPILAWVDANDFYNEWPD